MSKDKMVTQAAKKVSVGLQPLASAVSNYLEGLAGQEVGFAMVISVDNTAQYVSNCSREDGKTLIKELLAQWESGKADIPAHYNPDLSRDVARVKAMGAALELLEKIRGWGCHGKELHTFVPEYDTVMKDLKELM